MSFEYTTPLDQETALTTSSDKRAMLGARGITEDGRVFRYAQAGATDLVAYRIVCNPVESAYSTSTFVVSSAVYAAGTTYLLVGDPATASAVKNYFEDGWFFVNSTDVALHQVVQIDSHPAWASTTALGSANYVNLKRPGLVKALATSSGMIKAIPSLYKSVIVMPGDPASSTLLQVPLGVPQTTVTATYYFWLQTYGPALVLGDIGYASSNDLAGFKAVLASGGTGAFNALKLSGAVTGSDSGIEWHIPEIGWIMTANPADTFFTMVFLTMAS